MIKLTSYHHHVAEMLVALALAVGTAQGETLSAKTADTRTILAFSVPEAAAQDWLPESWSVSPLPKGPFEGANLLLVLIDRLRHQAPDGTIKGGGSYRMAVLVIPSRHADAAKTSLMIARVYGPHGGPGPYKNSVEATVHRQLAVERTGVGTGEGEDSWSVRPSEGGMLKVDVEYERAVPKSIEKEMRPRSAVEPDFFRIYRYQQLIDVVKSVPLGIDRVSKDELKVTIPELASMFDGNEQVLGIAIVPWYGRETYMP